MGAVPYVVEIQAASGELCRAPLPATLENLNSVMHPDI